MTVDTSDVGWLDQHQQRSWRAFLVGTTLLMDRLDRDLREQHRISLPEYEILVRLSEADGNRLRMAMLADSVSHSRSRVTHTVSRMETAGLLESQWEKADLALEEGRPRRRLYRVTGAGEKALSVSRAASGVAAQRSRRRLAPS